MAFGYPVEVDKCVKTIDHIPEHFTFDSIFADLPLKTIYYPTERNAKGLGIVLASYTWGGDSTRLLGMPDEEIFEEMMEGLAKVHGRSFK